MRHGTPERLLKPLAAAAAHEVFGDTDRWFEVLPGVEAALKESRSEGDRMTGTAATTKGGALVP